MSSRKTGREQSTVEDNLIIKNKGKIEQILKGKDPERIDKFISMLAGFTGSITKESIAIDRKPFKKFESKNKLTEEYQQIKKVRDDARKLFVSLIDCKDQGAVDRLKYYLKSTDLVIQISQAERIYSAANYILCHQEINSTGGQFSSLSESDKHKLRILKLLYKRHFPNQSSNFSSEGNVIYQIGCQMLGRNYLGKYPDKSIIQKSLEC